MRFAAVLLVGLVAACSNPDRACEPGRQIACPCAGGGAGVQVCKPSGLGYAACQCGADAPEASRDDIDEAVAGLKGFKARVCACKDQACVESVKKEMNAYGDAMGKKLRDRKPSEAQMKTLMELSKGMEECAERFADVLPPAP